MRNKKESDFLSYAILRMQKIKAVGIKGIQFHHQRERESKTNPDIDYEKSKLNYDLNNVYEIDFNKRVDEIIKENVVSDKKIRKDAVRLCDIVVTSDPKFFSKLTDKAVKKFFKDSYDFLCDRYKKENVVYSTVHLDETTPHMHFGVVPITDDKRLSAKEIFNRQELRDLQTDYHKFINEKGFNLERGVPSDKKGLSTQEFKKQTLKEDIEKKAKQKNILQKDLKALIEDLKILDMHKDDLNKINQIEAHKTFLNKNKVTISLEDYTNLVNIAKWAVMDKEKAILPYKELADRYKREYENIKKEFEKKKSLSEISILAREKSMLLYKLSKKENEIKELENFIRENDLVKDFEKSLEIEEKNFELEL